MWDARNAPASEWLVILAAIGVFDLAITTLGIILGEFGEINPMLNFVLTKYGLGGFILTKTFFVMWPVALLGALPWCWDEAKRKAVGDTYTLCAIILYVIIFWGGILGQYM